MTFSTFAPKFVRILSLLVAAAASAFAPLVAHAGTTTTLSITVKGGAAVTSVAPGTVVILTATVGVQTGLVNFCDATASSCTDQHLVGTAQLTSAGTATYKFIPGIGKHSYKAVFVGTKSEAGSSSTAELLTVAGVVAIQSSGSAGNYTLGATISAGLRPVGGSVSFLDTTNGNTSVGNATVVNTNTPLTFGEDVDGGGGITSYGGLAVGDFNGDGIPDLAAVSSDGSSTVAIFLGAANGTYGTPTTFTAGNNANSIAAGDFNGDGYTDLAVTNYGGASVSIFLGIGNGTFAAQAVVPVGNGPDFVAVGDFNGDGIPDLVVINYSDYTLSIALGKGDGSFSTLTAMAAGDSPQGVAIGDFNGDGIEDLAVASFNGNSVSILVGVGNGTFAVQPAIGVGQFPAGIAAGDLNGDGILDLVIGSSDAALYILRGVGDGTFSVEAPITVGNEPFTVALADFDGDGKLDIVAANYGDGTATVLLNNGDSTFTALTTISVGEGATRITATDINGDGKPDFVMVDEQDENVWVMLNKGGHSGTASLAGVSVPGNGTHAVLASYVGDANNGAGESATVNLTAEQVATTLAVSASPTTATYGQQVVLTAKLTPYVEGTLSTNGESVVFSNNGANIGTASLSSGTAVLNVTSLPVGTDFITAVYEGDSNFASSVSAGTNVTVSQASRATLSITPSSLSFTSSAVGMTTAAQVVTIKNTGTAAVSFTASTTITGSGASSFIKSASTCTNPLPAGASCTNSIEFDPTVSGALSAVITYTDTAAGSPQTVALSGTVASGGPTLSITPSSLSFGSTAVGTTTAAQVVTIKNTGTTAVSFTASTTITGSGASSFIKSASTCTNPLPAGASCTNSIEFDPTVSGALSAVITYMDTAAGSPQTVALSGTGGSAGPTLSITPGSLSFGSTAVGTTTAAQVVTIKNTGTTAVSFTASTTITGSGASSFIKSASTCTNPLPAGASCTNSIEFDPKAAGALSAVITYTDTAAGSPQTVTLTGTGTTATPTLSISPGSLSFGSTAVGTTTAAQLVTITNVSTAAVSFTASTTITGSGASSFIKSASTCTNPLPAGASCTNSIEFDPKAAGALSAVITYTDTAAGSPQTVALSGTGH
jgi:hypothetical protein